MPTVKLRKTGFRNFMGGVFAEHKTKTFTCQSGGFVEACYDREMARELLKIAEPNYWDENVGFVIAVNHLLLRKVGIGTKLQWLAGIDRQNTDKSMNSHMQQVFDRFIPDSGAKQVNIAYSKRDNLKNTWTAIKNAQGVSALLAARNEIASLTVSDPLARDISEKIISRRLYKTLKSAESPTEAEVLKRLRRMGPYANI